MNLFNKIVRIPNNLSTDIDIINIDNIDNINDKIYGLSIFSRCAIEWKSYIGTFPFLYGILVNLNHSNKIYKDMNKRLLKNNRMDLDDDFHGAIMFNLDSNNNPINIIKSFKINKNLGLDFLFKSKNDNENDDENLENNRLPKLRFKI